MCFDVVISLILCFIVGIQSPHVIAHTSDIALIHCEPINKIKSNNKTLHPICTSAKNIKSSLSSSCSSVLSLSSSNSKLQASCAVMRHTNISTLFRIKFPIRKIAWIRAEKGFDQLKIRSQTAWIKPFYAGTHTLVADQPEFFLFRDSVNRQILSVCACLNLQESFMKPNKASIGNFKSRDASRLDKRGKYLVVHVKGINRGINWRIDYQLTHFVIVRELVKTILYFDNFLAFALLSRRC